MFEPKGIVCAADDTVEPLVMGLSPTGKRTRIVNGMGIVHQCRDWGLAVKAVLQSQTAPLVTSREIGNGETVGSIRDLRLE